MVVGTAFLASPERQGLRERGLHYRQRFRQLLRCWLPARELLVKRRQLLQILLRNARECR